MAEDKKGMSLKEFAEDAEKNQKRFLDKVNKANSSKSDTKGNDEAS